MAKKVKEEEQSVVIGSIELATATTELEKYKKGKANLEKRIRENEQWYKQRHWEVFDTTAKDDKKPRPSSAWMFNSIENKHADAMDSYPDPNIMAREQGDEEIADMLSTIIPVVLDYNNYEGVYSDTWRYKLKTGTGVKKVFWNTSKSNGLGDIDIQKVDILNLFWEPGVSDIQKSRNFFHVELIDNDILKQTYPNHDMKLGGSGVTIEKYVTDDTVDDTNKSAVIDWYYKKIVGSKEVVHYVKFVNQTVLYSSEDVPDYATRGYYDHGEYPFVYDPMFTVEGSPCGFGYIDIMKDAQKYIDKMDQAFLMNTLLASKPKVMVRSGSGINMDEFTDMETQVVHVDGPLSDDYYRDITTQPLNSIYVGIKQAKVEELKETSNNRDFSQGSTASGVTAMGAIIALQEAGSKQSRDMIKASYRAFTKECNMIIELIRQFYEEPRYFRIIGKDYKPEYVQFDNSAIAPKPQGQEMGIDLGESQPIFDIKVTASKKSYFSRESQNQTMLQFFQLGFFNPQLADQALLCLDGMDFEKKENIIDGIKTNGTMFEQIQQMQQQMMQMGTIIDNLTGGQTQISQGMAQEQGSSVPMPNATQVQGKTSSERTAETTNKMATPK